MKFNLWLIILFALAPIFILFAGLGAAGGFASAAMWEILVMTVVAAAGVAFLAKRQADENEEPVADGVVPAGPAAVAGGMGAADSVSATRATPTLEDTERALREGFASPPCMLHEVDDAYLGYADREEVLALLNRLLEAERAGVRGARDMVALATDAQERAALGEVAHDEARFCKMLFGHITRLGETPTRAIGDFHERLAALPELDDRLQLMNRGQGWVAKKLREALPRIRDDALRDDLQDMLAVHEHNIERCAQLLEPAADAVTTPA